MTVGMRLSTRMALLVLAIFTSLISAEEPKQAQITARQVVNPAGGAGAAGGAGGIPTSVPPTTVTITSTDPAGNPVTIYSLYSANQKPITDQQFAQPQPGTIGMGTLTGQIGVVRTMSANPAPARMDARPAAGMGLLQGLAAFFFGLLFV